MKGAEKGAQADDTGTAQVEEVDISHSSPEQEQQEAEGPTDTDSSFELVSMKTCENTSEKETKKP